MSLPLELTIGELAKRTGVATSALRFYEEKGLISSNRTEGNQRRYPRATVRQVSIIRAAQRVGLSLEEIGHALEQLPQVAHQKDWERMATSWRSGLDARIEALQLLRDGLDSCIGCGCLSMSSCGLLNPNDIATSSGTGPRYILVDD